MMKLKDPRAIAIATSSLLVLLLGALFVQHFRHGWPFALHHGIEVPEESSRATTQDPSGLTPAHPRVEVEIDPAQIDAIGIRMETVREETISQALRAVATVVPDESRLSHVHTRVAGWIERLYVNTTGAEVRTGQPLAGIFSQELLSSQSEYLAALRTAAIGPASSIIEGARSRLRVLGMTDAEIRAIEETGEPRRLVTVTAPRSGVVLHRGISVGTAVDASTEIMTIADLSHVWVLAEVPESDVPNVSVGAQAVLEFAGSGREPFEARVEFLSPTLSERSRTLGVRFAVENPDGSLRPGIYGSATFHVTPRVALTVPRDAIVDTGSVQHVFVVTEGHRFQPRLVTLGTRFDDRVEIREGLVTGELIVASGVFLIDSESRLRASGAGTGHAHGGTEPEAHPDDESNAPPPPSGHEGH